MGEIGLSLVRGLREKDKRFERFWNYKPIPKLVQAGENFFSTKKHCKGIVGGNRSSKTTAAVFEAVMVYTGIIPPSMHGVYAHEETLRSLTRGPKKRARHVRIVVMDLKKHLNETILPMLTGENEGLLPEAWSTWDPSSYMFRGPDGSWLSIISVDPKEKVDPNRLRGPVIDHTFIDEINQELVLTESLARPAALNDGPRTVTMSFCPQEGFDCWTYRVFYKACYELKGNKTVRKPPEKCSTDVYAIQVCMKDNPSISQKMYEQQCRLYRPHERAYRVDGEYSNRTANNYYDSDLFIKWEEGDRCVPGAPFILHEREADTEAGTFTGELERLSDFVTMEGQRLDETHYPIWRMWERPGDGEKYIISADIAEGNEKSDPHSVSVWRVTDPEMPVQVAHLHMRLIKPGNLGVQAACMGNIFGNCLIIPECNNTGGGMFIDRIRNYPNLYRRPTVGNEVEKDTAHLGWHTDRYTKGPMLDASYKMLMNMGAMEIPAGFDEDGTPIFQNHCPFNSRITLMEFLSYEERIVKNKDDINQVTWGAKSGTHDDCLIDAVIAFRICSNPQDFGKVSTCKLKTGMVKPAIKDNHYLGKNSGQDERTAFKEWKKQPKLSELRKQFRGTSNAR